MAQYNAEPAKPAEAPKPAAKPWYESVLFKGYIQFDASFPEGKAVAGSNSNFRLRRARPTFVANLDSKTRVQMQLDIGSGKAGSGAATATVTDTFIERLVADNVAARAGQFLLPFGHEIHEDNAGVRTCVEMSFAAEQIALFERDLGVGIGTTMPEEIPFHWEFGFFNGQGYRTADSNNNKTFVGRAVVQPHKWFRVGASGMVGTYQGGTPKATYDREVLAAEVQVHVNKALSLEGELYNARFVDSPAAPTKAARFTGGYLLFETWIGPLQSIPFLRYQRTYGDLDYQSWDIGWRYQYSKTQRLTAQYDIVKGNSRNAFTTRWQVNF